MVMDSDEPAEMTSALGQGRVLSDTDPVHMAEMYTPVAARPTCHPDKLKLVLVGAVCDLTSARQRRTVCPGAYPVVNTTSTQ